MFNFSLDEVRTYAKDFNLIPVSMEFYADTLTPISIFKRLCTDDNCVLLESVEGNSQIARYSFIGQNPFLTLKSQNNQTQITQSGKTRCIDGNPIQILKSLLSKYKAVKAKQIPFTGGAVGFFGYDLIRYYENLPNQPQDDIDMPEAHFLLCDQIIAFDHVKQKVIIIVNLHAEKGIEAEYENAKEIVEQIRAELEKPLMSEQKYEKKELNYTSNVTSEQYRKIVEKAKEYIKDGDIFQVVLSQRLCVETAINPFDVYRALRLVNPSPYMYFLKFQGYTLAGASPEMLVRVTNGKVRNCPIAGTRKRGKTEAEDMALAKELLNDPKEVAEHNMLVDLGRNDIGKISNFGTVKVLNYKSIEKYSHVMHIVTNVEGKMNPKYDAFDALMAVMPAGTLSGAPKVRAMEIIDELENVKRGSYGGAIGYIGFDGDLDSCITIRTVVFKDGMAYIQAGAGIVADSVPEAEYEETLNKARAVLKAIQEAGEMSCL